MSKNTLQTFAPPPPPRQNCRTPRDKNVTLILKENNISINKKESKNINRNISSSARERADNLNKKSLTLPSYDEVMDELQVEPLVKMTLFEFIQYLALNRKFMTNEMLSDLIISLDMNYTDDIDKSNALKTAMARGYYTIKSSVATSAI